MGVLRNYARHIVKDGLVRGTQLLYKEHSFGNSCQIDSLQVPNSCQFGQHVRIAHDVRLGEGVRIGRYSYVMPYSTILRASIGKYCSIGQYVSIGGWQHPYNYPSTSPRLYRELLGIQYDDEGRRVEIGNDVWIGDCAIVLGGRIGNGAIIGAGAVVTKDVPPYAIVVGCPSKVISNSQPAGCC